MNDNILARLCVQHLADSGRLTSTAPIVLDGMTITADPASQAESGAIVDEFGFYGQPTEYFGRRNAICEKVIRQWARSDNKFDRQAAANAPTNFVFFNSMDQVNQSERVRQLFYKNHNYYFIASTGNNRIHPLKEMDNSTLPGHHFIAIGNFTLPGTDGRDEYMHKLDMYMQFWLANESERLSYEHRDIRPR